MSHSFFVREVYGDLDGVLPDTGRVLEFHSETQEPSLRFDVIFS